MSDDNVFGMLERTGGGSAPAAYIVESSYSENSWYRVWSDGWIEQGGNFSSLINEPSNVTFEIPYTKRPNVLFGRTRHSLGDSFISGIRQDSVTNTGFSVHSDVHGANSGQGNTEQNYWRAEGY